MPHQCHVIFSMASTQSNSSTLTSGSSPTPLGTVNHHITLKLSRELIGTIICSSVFLWSHSLKDNNFLGMHVDGPISCHPKFICSSGTSNTSYFAILVPNHNPNHQNLVSPRQLNSLWVPLCLSSLDLSYYCPYGLFLWCLDYIVESVLLSI
jgi:hypothetical protein